MKNINLIPCDTYGRSSYYRCSNKKDDLYTLVQYKPDIEKLLKKNFTDVVLRNKPLPNFRLYIIK